MKKIFLLFVSVMLASANPTRVLAQIAPSIVFTSSVNGTISPVTPTLSWSTSGAATCTAASSPIDAKWSGSVATSGSLAVGPITVATTYNLTCSSVSDATATLSWSAPTLNTDGSQITDLAGFKAYEIINSAPVLTTTMTGAQYTSVQILNLVQGTHTFYVTAFNTGGIESSPSNQGSKTIVAAASASKSLLVDVQKKPAPPQIMTVR